MGRGQKGTHVLTPWFSWGELVHQIPSANFSRTFPGSYRNNIPPPPPKKNTRVFLNPGEQKLEQLE